MKVRGLQAYKDLAFSHFPKVKLIDLIQKFSDKYIDKSFKHIGNDFDFFHGHLIRFHITEEPSLVLYHTQENASQNRHDSCKYTYANRLARNHIQWIEKPLMLKNAISYTKPGRWDDSSWLENFNLYYTLHEDDLLVGKKELISSFEDQFVFFKVNCSNIPDEYKNIETNFFELTVRNQKECFLFTVYDTCAGLSMANDNSCVERWLKK